MASQDDEDNGDSFTYTGAGGRDLSGNKRTAEQSFDQVLNKSNAAIARYTGIWNTDVFHFSHHHYFVS